MKNKAIFPGFFDPFTSGHADCLHRGALLFDEVVVAVAKESAKKAIVPADIRCEMIKKCVEKYKNITVEAFDGALIDFCAQKNINFVLRGMRNINDFEYERQLGNVYKTQRPEVECIYLITDQKLSHISSSIVKEIVALNGSCKGYVPEEIEGLVYSYYRKEKK